MGTQKKTSGVALLLVLVSLAFISVISVEIIFSSRVDFRIARNARDRLQAEYLAQSAANLSLLRISIYGELKNLLEGNKIPLQVPEQAQDQIWGLVLPQFPLEGVSSKKTDHYPGYFLAEIKTEGSKIPINLLDGNIHRGENLKEQTLADLRQLIEAEFKKDEFVDIYDDLKVDDLVNPLIDWIDADSAKVDGGDESSDYETGSESYQPRNDRIPTLSELVMVRNWNDDLVRRFGPSLSVLNNSNEVNANFLPLSRIQTFGPDLTEAELKIIDARRRETPFSGLSDLESFVKTNPDIKNGQSFAIPQGLKDQKSQTVFWIKASGVVGEARKTLNLGVRLPREKTQDPRTGKINQGKLKAPQVVLVEEKL